MIVRDLEFTITPTELTVDDDDMVAALIGHRIVMEYWVNPMIKGDDSLERVQGIKDWIASAAYHVLMNPGCTKDMSTEGWQFKLYAPDGALLFDTLTRSGPKYHIIHNG